MQRFKQSLLRHPGRGWKIGDGCIVVRPGWPGLEARLEKLAGSPMFASKFEQKIGTPKGGLLPWKKRGIVDNGRFHAA